ncbi:MAG: ferrous iron transport protein B [Planctomycetes bacterium]|nr:ferrous iron transport protein B [Planctomycetota bacterium]
MNAALAPQSTAATVATPLRVVLAGNPNAGKSTLFNSLTGLRAKVANYPGVTVEIETGPWQLPAGSAVERVELIDLPGCYSLSALSAEEHVAITAIAGLPPVSAPAAVVIVADATELARHLYLALQIRELDVPAVLALTMVDALEKGGATLDLPAIERELGLPAVAVHGRSGRGLAELGKALARVLAEGPCRRRELADETPALRADLDAVAAEFAPSWSGGDAVRARALARWTLLSADEAERHGAVPRAAIATARARRDAAQAAGRDLDVELVGARYRWIDDHVAQFVPQRRPASRTPTDRLDAVLLHPLLGFAIFAIVMTIVFQALFVGADPLIAIIESGVASASSFVEGLLPEGLLRGFLVDGVIAGVGAVVVFLPQILLMFLFLGLLEDSGYMARVVVLMDRVMRSAGLHGRAFVPMLSAFACAVPAVLATRTMERRRDRLLTMMVVPLMTCSARLPVYGLLIAALYPVDEGTPFAQGALMAAMYVFSVLVALLAAHVIGRTLLRGRPAPLVMQMPPYRRPQLRTVARMMVQRAGVFVRDAGTVILACTVVLWFLLSFPSDPKLTRDYEGERAAAKSGAILGTLEEPPSLTERLATIDAAERGERMRSSYAGRLGHALEPVLAPLGFDWQINIGVLGAFAAREVFVATMGVVYGLGDVEDETATPLRDRIRAERRADGSRVFSPRTCLSLMIFFALACQCMSTLAAVKRESGGWKWPLFLFAYMSGLAWLASFAVYQLGGLVGLA